MRVRARAACPGHVDDVGASLCGRTIIQRARGWTAETEGVGAERGPWTLDAGWWMLQRGMAVHEVVDFTRSIAGPAAPPPYARACTPIPKDLRYHPLALRATAQGQC